MSAFQSIILLPILCEKTFNVVTNFHQFFFHFRRTGPQCRAVSLRQLSPERESSLCRTNWSCISLRNIREVPLRVRLLSGRPYCRNIATVTICSFVQLVDLSFASGGLSASAWIQSGLRTAAMAFCTYSVNLFIGVHARGLV